MGVRPTTPETDPVAIPLTQIFASKFDPIIESGATVLTAERYDFYCQWQCQGGVDPNAESDALAVGPKQPQESPGFEKLARAPEFGVRVADIESWRGATV